MRRAGAATRLVAAACLGWAALAACMAAGAQDATAPDPSATPQPDATVRDPDFGVSARHLGLEREVEMFQWRARADGSYERAWSDAAIDSAGFAPGHDNPPFPLHGRRWTATEVRVDGVRVDPSVLQALGRWTPFRPSFSALPGNLAATFQPQGDGLGSAENPMAPEVGDLRIHWRDLVLPPLGDRIVLDAGRWRLASGVADDAVGAGREGSRAETATPRGGPAWVRRAGLLTLLLGVIAAGFALARRRRRR
jgi:hypothetical protein